MIAQYRLLLALPGALGFFIPGFIPGFIARFPIAMRPLGCVLLVSQLTGSYGLAGATSAALTLTQAAASPRLGRLADQLGQRRVLLLTLIGHAVGMTSLIVAAQRGAPEWVLLGSAALAGAFAAPINAMVLARWARLVNGQAGEESASVLGRAYALESVLTEIVFVLGPFLVTALALGLFPASGLIAALVLIVIGGLWLGTQRSTEPPPGAETNMNEPAAIRQAGLRIVVLTFIGCGTIFGSVEVGLVAFDEERGHQTLTGLLIALFAVGSLAAAVLYGAKDWRLRPDRRFALAVAWLFLGTIPILLSPNIPLMALSVTLAVIAIAPASIAGSTLIETIVPSAVLTEGFAWFATATVVGMALGAAVGGWVIDGYGSRPAFLVSMAGGAFALLTVLVGGLHLTGGSRRSS